MSGTHQLRQPIKDGGSYDIPYGSLIPLGLKNVLLAGRCFSAEREALRAGGEGRRAGAIVLVDADGRLSGIFTDGDLRRHVNSGGISALDTPISGVMTRHPTMLTVESLVRDAVQLVQSKRLDEIPVVDREGRPVGLVDVQDLIAMRVVKE